MSLPNPKEILKKVAEIQDNMVEFAIKPVKDMATNLGLPEPPEPPKASDIVDSLPDLPELPAMELPIPTPSKTEAGAMKIREPVKTTTTRIKVKIV